LRVSSKQKEKIVISENLITYKIASKRERRKSH
jgi:hypothetical protein